MVNKPLISPYFWGGYVARGGGRLTSHKNSDWVAQGAGGDAYQVVSGHVFEGGVTILQYSWESKGIPPPKATFTPKK